MPNLPILTFAGALTLSAIALPAVAQARVALNQEPHINGSLLSAAIAAMIADQCDTIVPRRWTALIKAWQLKNYALNHDYTEAEIDIFISDKSEQDRMQSAAETYLAKNGVERDNEQSFCTLGRTEIANGTLAGQLIRAK